VTPPRVASEHAARGKSARATVPRSRHRGFEPAADWPDPVEVLEAQAESRVPELVPIRYGRMLVSPFTFYRGAAAVMADDLARGSHAGLRVQLCGDAHLSNFGVFAAPDRRLVFELNDFDETLPGPFEWDLKRLVASFAVAGRDRGFDETQRRAVNLRVTRAYRQAMRRLAGMRTLDVWYSRVDVDDIMRAVRGRGSKREIRQLEKDVAKMRAKDSIRAFSKLTRVVDGEPRIRSDPPLITPIEEVPGGEDGGVVAELVHGSITRYRSTLPADRQQLVERFRYVHAARKVVGVGSVGTRAWIALMLGRHDRDPLFIQVKEAQASVLEQHLGKSEYATHGQRVVEGQRLMQAASDIMLGWDRIPGPDGVERDFYIRQLWDQKGSAQVDVMGPATMRRYADLCGQTLARARTLRRCRRDRRIHGLGDVARRRPGGFRRGVCGPERARLRRAQASRDGGAGQGQRRSLDALPALGPEFGPVGERGDERPRRRDGRPCALVLKRRVVRGAVGPRLCHPDAVGVVERTADDVEPAVAIRLERGCGLAEDRGELVALPGLRDDPHVHSIRG
jgi:uncharacterized protein (DUF2252 family)